MASNQRKISIRGAGVGNMMQLSGKTSNILPDAPIITDAPRCNNSMVRCSTAYIPPLLPYDQWKDWGINRPTQSCLFAEATCGDLKLCIKMAINLDKEPEPNPDARDPDAAYDPDDSTNAKPPSHHRVAQALLDEYHFYQDNLQDLEGTLVPRHYGIWSFNSTWGGIVIVSAIEWAGSSAFHLFESWTDRDTLKQRVACVLATSQLHKHGIEHGQLLSLSSARHVLFDPESETVRFVDFSCSKAAHKCARPVFPSLNGTFADPGCCPEVAAVTRILGIYDYVSPLQESDDEDEDDVFSPVGLLSQSQSPATLA
ncbi:hypothetical protein HGRIS_005561 [Hohenbuehelia grisea]|uniref:Protein kinase domain-containing protein n=1 Tax=Hohenbuehelia grisea TaxID=104357 RepID=A0ABR3JY93_9AGAR